MRVKIHHEGFPILLVMLIVTVGICLPLWLFVRPLGWAILATVVLGSIFLLAVNFFRSPRREFTGDRHNVVVSSADGKVVALEEVYEPEYLKCRCIQLSVFMSILNVHANWFPVDGKVVYCAHHRGNFLKAWLPKASTENERSTVVIEATNGQLVLMRQVAGAMARRIVTYADPGDDANIEDHMGFIKFGSRIDLYLPLGTKTNVQIGDLTVGGVTEVARLADCEATTATE